MNPFVIPLAFNCHLSLEQKSKLLSINCILTSLLSDYLAICEEKIMLKDDILNSVISDISSAIHYNQFKRFKFSSYSLRMALLKLSFIASVSKDLTSISSRIIDDELAPIINEISTIIFDCYELLKDAK